MPRKYRPRHRRPKRRQPIAVASLNAANATQPGVCGESLRRKPNSTRTEIRINGTPVGGELPRAPAVNTDVETCPGWNRRKRRRCSNGEVGCGRILNEDGRTSESGAQRNPLHETPPLHWIPILLVPLDHLSIQHCENMLSTFRLVVARPQQTKLQHRRPQTAVARCYAAILAGHVDPEINSSRPRLKPRRTFAAPAYLCSPALAGRDDLVRSSLRTRCGTDRDAAIPGSPTRRNRQAPPECKAASR